jgi:hypothetical protein
VSDGGRRGRGALHQPDGIAVGPNGDIWVSDTGSDQGLGFGRDAKTIVPESTPM